ncbi:hypothetical protein LOK49_LG07G01126 [Camellia lanceoleosa]|uniref:Uncharacterized protein n=1 Tax=Camellia lanceoleosa TaxID=1840588 RepID=A0ACC0H838_9ERIC|nr:hypothetical protein LOK49_LG07G01126 [Camellia lanceoleosa]
MSYHIEMIWSTMIEFSSAQFLSQSCIIPLRFCELEIFQMTSYHSCRPATWLRTPGAKTNLKPATQLAIVQKRWASQSTPAEDNNKISIGPRRGEAGDNEKDTGVVYYGPISSTIKKLKLLSLPNCWLSVSLGPLITFMTTQDMNVILKGAVAFSVVFLSAPTTAALHWFVSPYVHKLRWKPG